MPGIEVVDAEVEKLKLRYNLALHAIQTGVRMLIECGEALGTPADLRVGVNSAHVSDAAIVKLLVAKGIITWGEFFESIATQAEEEKEVLERRLADLLGRRVVLL